MIILTLTVACGSGTSKAPQQETPISFPTTGAQTPQRETPIPFPTTAAPTSPTKTPIPFPTFDAQAQPLQPYTSQLFQYSMEIPEGWEPGATTFGADLFKLQQPDRLFADIEVNRQSAPPGTTADTLLDLDVKTVNGSHFGIGTIASSDAVDVVVAGYPGRSIRYMTGVGGGTETAVIVQEAVYVVIGDYAWTFRLHVYNPSVDTEPFVRLFGRVLATFQPG